jgi:hypothetical protein
MKTAPFSSPRCAARTTRAVACAFFALATISATSRAQQAPTTTAATAPSLDLAHADVAGLRVGMKAKVMEGALQRLFGPVERQPAGAMPRVAARLVVNEMGCMDIPGRRRNARPGDVCVTAFLDDDDIVRAVRIERIFPPCDVAPFRRALLQKYGPTADDRFGFGVMLSWGAIPEGDFIKAFASLPFALTARFEEIDSFSGLGLNRIPDVHVTLQLADAAWASALTAR